MLRMPALFLGHGSPMTVITDSPERQALEDLGRALPRPRAILCITAHWETRGRTHVTSGEQPATIHDFRGFPQQLYDIAYPAPGSPWLAAKVSALLGEDRVLHDPNRGFDHGVWGVLRPVFPDAEIPVAAMSLDRALPPDQHLAIGRALAPLREEGVMIVGSGNVVHNLAHWGASQGTRPEWAVQFQARTNAAMSAGDDSALFRLPADDRAAALAINSGEHYLPLLYVAGARLPGDQVTVFNDTIDGSLSMTSYLVGEPVPPG